MEKYMFFFHKHAILSKCLPANSNKVILTGNLKSKFCIQWKPVFHIWTYECLPAKLSNLRTINHYMLDIGRMSRNIVEFSGQNFQLTNFQLRML